MTAARASSSRRLPKTSGETEPDHDRQSRQPLGSPGARARLPDDAAADPAGDDLLQDLRRRDWPSARRSHLARRPARAETDAVDGRDLGPAEHDLRDRLRAAAGPP